MFVNNFIIKLFKSRIKEIERLRIKPEEAQESVFDTLIKAGKQTEYGEKYNFGRIRNIEDFRKNVPVSDYAILQPYIKRMRSGERKVLWNTPVRWFAKSSGTTAGKSKFIPVSRECLHNCHFSGSKDATLQYLINNPNSKILLGKSLTLGGSHKIDEFNSKVKIGDLSAILIHNSPRYVELVRTPSKKAALMLDFDEKTRVIARQSSVHNVIGFAGVPSWNLILMNRILEYTGKKHLLELWPNLEVFFHGGVAFGPYVEQFKRIIPSDNMRYMETYNASEGFFAFQDMPDDDSMLLLTNNSIFFEFMHLSELEKPFPKTYSISEVQTGVNYAMIISTNSGLWRYLIGDTVKFTSLYPHKIKITGRTAYYINVFGEELIAGNAEEALLKVCSETNAIISEYTVAPIFMSETSNGAHEWLIEFDTPPQNVEHFANLLDKTLCELNSDYEAKRYHNITLSRLKITVLPNGTFLKWMESKGKLGGQNKIPRLYNSREHADQLLRIMNTRTKY
ncbi:MAG: GH3 auxin-responsive promoter family protein [Prevotellaceae bacterium]|jgi:hypothetical protein|nr:GH3 auxin-responsive promoter family protein [Prevotellaceae bacterium]